MALDIDTVFRDNKIKGDIHSDAHWPEKPEIRQLLKQIQASGGQSVTRSTLAALNAVTPPAETYMGIVLTGNGAGMYGREAGAWVFGRPFPDTFAKVVLAGSGTAQTGVVNAGVIPSGIEVFYARVFTPNTGPLTLSISGEPARQVINLAGNPLSAGEWTGMVVFYLNDANQYQLLIDAGAAASAAASATLAQYWAEQASEAVIPNGSITDLKVADSYKAKIVGVAANRAALAAMSGATYLAIDLMESGRKGLFQWDGSNRTASVTADTEQGVFIAPASDPSGASGAWVRVFDGDVLGKWFNGKLQVAVNVAAVLSRDLNLGRKGDSYVITAGVTIPDDMRVFSDHAAGQGAKIDASSGNFKALTLGQRVKLSGIEIKGPGNNVYHEDSYGVFQTGTNNAPLAPTYVDGPTIEHCLISGFRNAGIELRYSDNFTVRHSKVNNSGYAGIIGVSVRIGDVYKNTVDGVSPGASANAYGIAMTKFHGDQVGYPKSRDVSVRHCEVKNVPLWHAFDIHGSDNVVFSDCIARNCKRGFVITAASDAAGGRYGSKKSGFVRCSALEGLATHTEKGQAFWFIGANNASSVIVDYAEDCFLENCFADGYGEDKSTGSGPVVSIEGVRRLRINGLTMINSVGRGILFGKECLEFSIDGLTISDIYSNYRATLAIGFNGNNIKGRIRDYNLINTGITPGSFRNDIGLYSASSLTGLQVSFGSGRNLSATPTSYGTAPSAYDA